MYYICNTGDILTTVQVNIRTTPFLAKELDLIVKEGYFRNRTEAVNEAIRLLIKRYELSKIKASIESIMSNGFIRGNHLKMKQISCFNALLN